MSDDVTKKMITMSQLQTADNYTICVLMAQPTVTSFAYRLAQFIHILLTSMGIIFTLCCLNFLSKKLYFHVNLNILIYFVLINANILSLQMLIMQIRHLADSFLSVEPCDVFVSASDCFPYLTINAFCLGCITGAQVCMCVERIVATCLMKKYQRVGSTLGIGLTLLTILVFGFLVWDSYWGDPHDEAFLTCFSIPARSADKANQSFVLMLASNLFAILSLLGINAINRNYRTRTRFALGDRYQVEENLSTSSHIFVIVTVQFLIISFYGAATLLLRINRAVIAEQTHRTAILFVYVVPYYTCILPLLLTFVVRRGVVRRGRDIASMVAHKSTGDAGRDNYFDELLKQWA